MSTPPDAIQEELYKQAERATVAEMQLEALRAEVQKIADTVAREGGTAMGISQSLYTALRKSKP